MMAQAPMDKMINGSALRGTRQWARRRSRAWPVAAIIAGAVALSACQSGQVGFKPTTMSRGLVSAEIGKGLGYADRRKDLRMEFEALERGATGAPLRWTGWGGRRGNVIPGAAYRVNSQDCRDYSHTVYVKEEAAVARGTACRKANGGWKLAS